MNNIREIYTKAIVAKGKKLSRNTYSFDINQTIGDILKTYITNHHYEAQMKNTTPYIIGTFDLYVWCTTFDKNDTHTYKYQVTYMDEMKVYKKENREFDSKDELKSRCLSQPVCLSIVNNQNKFIVEIQKEMQIEITGETCIKVEVKDEPENWEDIDDIEIDPHFITP